MNIDWILMTLYKMNIFAKAIGPEIIVECEDGDISIDTSIPDEQVQDEDDVIIAIMEMMGK